MDVTIAHNGTNGHALSNGKVPARSRRSNVEQQLALLTAPEAAELPSALESLLFVAPEPVEVSVLARSLGVRIGTLERAAADLGQRLRGGGLRLQRCDDRMQLVTAPEWSSHIERFLGVAAEQPLSNAALETLAIVAYRQPVTRATIEGIRGVNAERALGTLRSRGLVDEVGRGETIGHPVLFGTTMQFLEYMGLESLSGLPSLPEDESD